MCGVSPSSFIALHHSRPALTHTRMQRRCGSRLLRSDILRCTCHLTFHSNDGQGHVIAHSACHKERSLISSVPHAILDDKMATAAILTVLMWKSDSSFIYCHHAALRVQHKQERKNSRHSEPEVFWIFTAAAEPSLQEHMIEWSHQWFACFMVGVPKLFQL